MHLSQKQMNNLMDDAIELAKNGQGFVSPNPLVGAILVRLSFCGRIKVLGKGYHHKCGEPHAEVMAIRDAEKNGFKNLQNAILIVTLEPCCHFGKTPPCTELILQKGIKTVICGSVDSNEKVLGKGIEILRARGVKVICGIREKECKNLNKIFFTYITKHRPFVLYKCAMSLDGKTAIQNVASEKISSRESQKEVHSLRAKYKGIMCGIKTVQQDNPLLNVRKENGDADCNVNQPVRIIVDTNLSISEESKIVKTATKQKTILLCSNEAFEKFYEKRKRLESKKIEIISLGKNEKTMRLDLAQAMSELSNLGIDSILLEGGGTLASSMIKENLVDSFCFYIAPIFLGGEKSSTPIFDLGIDSVLNGVKLKNITTRICGADTVLEGDVCLPE